MITDKISENNINLIFAVTSNMVPLYRVSFLYFCLIHIYSTFVHNIYTH